jgi:hypothetical protein
VHKLVRISKDGPAQRKTVMTRTVPSDVAIQMAGVRLGETSSMLVALRTEMATSDSCLVAGLDTVINT